MCIPEISGPPIAGKPRILQSSLTNSVEEHIQIHPFIQIERHKKSTSLKSNQSLIPMMLQCNVLEGKPIEIYVTGGYQKIFSRG